MKNKEDIIRRAICLICYSDRCFLEDNVFDGIRRSLKEREDQRQIIIKWLKEKKYYDYLTLSEKQIVETPVVKQTNDRPTSIRRMLRILAHFVCRPMHLFVNMSACEQAPGVPFTKICAWLVSA